MSIVSEINLSRTLFFYLRKDNNSYQHPTDLDEWVDLMDKVTMVM